MLAVCCPRSALCEPYVGPMFAYVSRMWPQVGPMLALCWPKLALCWPYVGPILALCRPIMSTNLAEPCSNTFNMSFFPVRDPPWTRKPRKTHSFLIVPRSISGAPKATKHRKTRCFSTPRTKNTVIYRGSGGSEVTPRWRWGDPPWGRRLGRLATITFGYRPKASGQGTGRLGHGPAPGLRATAHAADPWIRGSVVTITNSSACAAWILLVPWCSQHHRMFCGGWHIPAGSRPEERDSYTRKGAELAHSKRTYNHKQERGFRTMAAQILVSVRFEKTETPARFEPMPSKKHADRMLQVTFGTHKKQSFGSKHPNASSSRASAKQKTVRNAHITTSRNVDSERWLLKVSSASDSKRPKHQQDSSPCQAKNTQTECFTSPLEPMPKK